MYFTIYLAVSNFDRPSTTPKLQSHSRRTKLTLTRCSRYQRTAVPFRAILPTAVTRRPPCIACTQSSRPVTLAMIAALHIFRCTRLLIHQGQPCTRSRQRSSHHKSGDIAVLRVKSNKYGCRETKIKGEVGQYTLQQMQSTT